jgi:hypothetical protein
VSDPCESDEDRDFTSVWGAGIGLHLNQAPGEPPEWYDATQHGIVGIAFEIESQAEIHLRVGIVTLDDSSGRPSEDVDEGSPYWGAKPDGQFAHDSPVDEGNNQFLWSDVRWPQARRWEDDSSLDPSNIRTIQFHVPAADHENWLHGRTAIPYNFCIRNLALLRDKDGAMAE